MKSLHVILSEALVAFPFELKNDGFWCSIETALALQAIAEILLPFNARVCMISAYEKEGFCNLVYHFDVEGLMIHVSLGLSEKKVISLSSLFPSANWAERELSELFGVEVMGHPSPESLFLDETIRQEAMKEYHALSLAMNGTLGKTLLKKQSEEEK